MKLQTRPKETRMWDRCQKTMIYLDRFWNDWWYPEPRGVIGNKDRKVAVRNNNLTLDTSIARLNFSEPMDYTGLKDKNQEKIFEGDIIKWDLCNELIVISFIEGSYGGLTISQFHNPEDQMMMENIHWYTSKGCQIKVVGNIFENPELLEGK